MKKPKLCLHCNYKAELIDGGWFFGLIGWWRVRCGRCGIQTPRCRTPEEAIELWNREG